MLLYPLQDFYNILYNSNNENYISVIVVKNIRDIWINNKKLWFSHCDIIQDKNQPNTWTISGFQLETEKENIFYNYNSITDTKHNIDIIISLILQYDQLTRHPTDINYQDNQNQNKKALYFKFASQLALFILNSEYYNKITIEEKIFILLTLRHNDNIRIKYFVLSKLNNELIKFKDNQDNNNENKYSYNESLEYSLWLRFLNATITDINNFKIKNKVFDKMENIRYNITFQQYYFNKSIEVIEHKDEANNIITTGTRKELENTYTRIYNIMNELIKKSSIINNKIAVSISGGVDSMVASYILNDLCNKIGIEMILIHICYNNRESCINEKNLLYYWSSKLKTKLFIRNIDEIQRSRNSKFRALYEDITRKIRFSYYKYFNCPIILGHNRDDTFENMFSNLSKNNHFDNLKGMNDISYECGVELLRPLLTIDKKNIIELSNYFNIPHLIDSTPKWSRRGKTRDELIPSIDNFDKGILHGLEKLTEYTGFLYKQWVLTFNEWTKKIIHEDNEIIICRDIFFNNNYSELMFWTKLWFHLELQTTRPSNKSFYNIIDTLKRYENETLIHKNKNVVLCKCTINKKYILFIYHNRIVIQHQ